ncbi:uncharacterized protein Dmoj_GI19857, isoform E [Drosophila mojavensis]|uniref:Uncharacterized protein, isoform B n=1 Tax=Drosophila mojavensis TaxID=7230 RepID=A0A0Q9X681_DROMO|nr:uncharacterized protein Dmoj_GI19857, isoform B [Drosophila mojavensis]KRG03767.1 uncharacterized protein Dmoj_GI19857, isoform C [Drosophila mojavensis]KRG03768.1 uncharacterized protein Dmoj_GI19857, isoform D [Drosophila mojavensis]KRG03769.1 uncharacterized protein Dmoj_GI19857, isoform E [Drosophila mojavensis]
MCIKNCDNIHYGGSSNNSNDNNNNSNEDKVPEENFIQLDFELRLPRRGTKGPKISSFKIFMCCCYFIIIVLMI